MLTFIGYTLLAAVGFVVIAVLGPILDFASNNERRINERKAKEYGMKYYEYTTLRDIGRLPPRSSRL